LKSYQLISHWLVKKAQFTRALHSHSCCVPSAGPVGSESQQYAERARPAHLLRSEIAPFNPGGQFSPQRTVHRPVQLGKSPKYRDPYSSSARKFLSAGIRPAGVTVFLTSLNWSVRVCSLIDPPGSCVSVTGCHQCLYKYCPRTSTAGVVRLTCLDRRPTNLLPRSCKWSDVEK